MGLGWYRMEWTANRDGHESAYSLGYLETRDCFSQRLSTYFSCCATHANVFLNYNAKKESSKDWQGKNDGIRKLREYLRHKV